MKLIPGLSAAEMLARKEPNPLQMGGGVILVKQQPSPDTQMLSGRVFVRDPRVITADGYDYIVIDGHRVPVISTTAAPNDELPALPSGFVYLTDSKGVYLTNAAGEFLIANE